MDRARLERHYALIEGRLCTGRLFDQTFLIGVPHQDFDDVRKLLEVLHRLTDLGNTVIIIEHNLDVVRNADWIVDLGPEGGEEGGRLIAEGTPSQIAAVPNSYTGQFLAKHGVMPQLAAPAAPPKKSASSTAKTKSNRRKPAVKVQ